MFQTLKQQNNEKFQQRLQVTITRQATNQNFQENNLINQKRQTRLTYQILLFYFRTTDKTNAPLQ